MSKPYWHDEEALYENQDIDSALAAFDCSKWKERVNKIYTEPYLVEPNQYDRPLNRFR